MQCNVTTLQVAKNDEYLSMKERKKNDSLMLYSCSITGVVSLATRMHPLQKQLTQKLKANKRKNNKKHNKTVKQQY